ncbi:phosphoglycerate mutase-like protein [Dendrothele bispora CBS 962.96]|uniref:Phosphoglycerate mutase-like protein n=1 Tax=Dendrothele bispora (strain CBS 962.96) TaxID=1314807 RepID=A0A4S8LCZ7_DENBC|nr:phosphoglycerate mutase-like protein [Dendrothele bispora CBS 962.96]
MSDNSKVLGVVVIARHGDRQGFYQDPNTYTASSTVITPLGEVQEFRLGQLIRSHYLNSSSPLFISGVNSSVPDQTQILARADAGGEGGVIVNSAMALLQGLFPANPNATTTLANGTTVSAPLNGYQYLPIESVEPDNDVSLEGWTQCAAFDQSTQNFYQSAVFQQKKAESASFLSQLPRYLDGRNATLENMWNIFDFMNVEDIHDSSFAQNLPENFLEQARDLANFHEYGVFSDPDLAGIGNIAFRTTLPSVLNGLNSIQNSSQPLKLVYEAVSYKPFLSMFNMTGAAAMNPQLAGVVNYAAAVILEVLQPSDSSSEPVIRFKFKNGTDDPDFKTYNFMNSTQDVALSTFVNYMAPAAINSTSEWCTICGNTQNRGCGAISAAAANARAAAAVHQPISPVGAGFLGAGLTIFVALCMLGILFFLGILTVGRGKSRRNRKSGSESDSIERKA